MQSTQNQTLMDAIKVDHAEINSYYNEFCKATGNLDLQQRWANQLTWEVARHAVGEELVAYPLFEKHLGENGRDMADSDRAEHQAVKERLYKLEKLKVGTDEFNTTLKDVMGLLHQHIQSEEQNDLPALESAMGNDASIKAATSFRRTKKFAPTRAHPSAPDKGPFETVTGLLTAPIDKLRDMFTKFPTAEMKQQAGKT
ncbi:hypothetical protein AMATHDRAFT_147633 [Amanita thiersii Skay4041]|uniref:Hemerythrin-like domain-containing protein n=1 Tax=Amanita thiersii Skay4041 TaxID=703135 RepID=A0A2A9NMJ5_9AGAR|nr:hypothetical protein AMATHDRAFT_147633 [Amanita thiersii Skay4041]